MAASRLDDELFGQLRDGSPQLRLGVEKWGSGHMRHGLVSSSCCFRGRLRDWMGRNSCSMFFKKRRRGFFDRRRGLENVHDVCDFNAAQLRGYASLHWLELSEVIGSNAGESILFIGPGVDRQFRGPLQIVLTRKRQKVRRSTARIASNKPDCLRHLHLQRKYRTRRSCDRCQ